MSIDQTSCSPCKGEVGAKRRVGVGAALTPTPSLPLSGGGC